MSAAETVTESLIPTLQRYTGAKRWLVALSGGLDSTVLLHLLHSFCENTPNAPPLTAIHVDHGLQSQSSEWATQCRKLCDSWGIPIQLHAVAVDTSGSSIEAAARRARYYVFEEVLGKKDLIFTGHHLDDQVETFFLRALRGAGVEGLAAIPEERRIGKASMVRPLLALSRAQLLAYANELGIRYITDPSNADIRFDRNFLRQQVLPLLEQRWPGYRETVGRCAGHLGVAAQRLRGLSTALTDTSTVMGDPGFYLASLLTLTKDEAASALRRWLKQRHLSAPDTKPMKEFLRQLQLPEPGSKVRLDTGSWCLQRFGDGVYLCPGDPKLPQKMLSFSPANSLELAGVGKLSLEPASGAGLVLPESGEFKLGFRRGGEHCHPLHRQHSAPLKLLFQEAQIPPWWRSQIPLLYAEGQLVAVGDLFLCRSDWLAQQSATRLWTLRWDRGPALA